jgi:hypothetical protein
MRLPTPAVLALVAAAAPAARAAAPDIRHDSVGCLVAQRYPTLRACFTPSSQVAKARVYFRREDRPTWYHVEMKSDAPCFVGTLPRPLEELVGTHVPYYVEVASRDLAVGRTAEYAPVVVARASECGHDPVAASVPKAAVEVFPRMPAGFGGGTGLGPLALGAGGAAGVGAVIGVVAVGSGGSSPPASAPPPATPAPPAASPAPAPAPSPSPLPSPSPAPGNAPPNAVFAVSPDPPSGASPTTVRFNSCRSSDPDGDPLAFRYDFGDGQRSRGSCREEHAYLAPGPGESVYRAEACVGDGLAGHERCQAWLVRVMPVAPPPPPSPPPPPPGSVVLSVSFAGTGSGTVTSGPAGIACAPTCSASYPAGTVVTLTAAANPGSTFAGWSGGGCTGAGTCRVTLSTAQAVTATFDTAPPGTFPLTVNVGGTGGGSVGSTPPGIDACRTSCTASFTSGTVVTLAAAADGGSTFAGWSGGGCSGSGTCQVTMSAARTVTATFNAGAPATHRLFVNKAGTGTGTVSSDVRPGIDCGAFCSFPFTAGTVVTLGAAPDAGSLFAGWSGAGCTGTGGCTVTMDREHTVTATFDRVTPPQRVLTVGVGGSGTGSVSGPGIDCPGDCSQGYASGTRVDLSASASGGSVFAGWSGACSGTGGCQVTMDGDRDASATFDPPPTRRLTVGVGGPGQVNSNPGGITCFADQTCSADFPLGSSVTLNASPTPLPGQFDGWGGDCASAGTSPSCTLTMNADRNVVAGFSPIFPSPRTAPPAGAAWSSELKVPRGRGQVVVNGEAREVGAGLQRAAFAGHDGENRIEATLIQAGGAGTWRFDLPQGTEPGSLRVTEGRVQGLEAGAVIFRLAGKPGERVAFTFRWTGQQ